MRQVLLFVIAGLVVMLSDNQLWAQGSQAAPAAKDFVAVVDLTPVGAQPTQAAAATDRLREELLASGRFTVVSRDQIDKVLEEQARQQQTCPIVDCSVKVAKILGVRKIISGRLTRVDDDLWMMAVTLVDVETARTERAASVTHEGKFASLLTEGVRKVSMKLSGQ